VTHLLDEILTPVRYIYIQIYMLLFMNGLSVIEGLLTTWNQFCLAVL